MDSLDTISDSLWGCVCGVRTGKSRLVASSPRIEPSFLEHTSGTIQNRKITSGYVYVLRREQHLLMQTNQTR